MQESFWVGTQKKFEMFCLIVLRFDEKYASLIGRSAQAWA